MMLNKEFWEQRYQENQTQWDIGHVSPPLKNYIDQLKNKDLKILVPGAGNGHEVEYLYNNGFKNVYTADIAIKPLNNLKARVKDLPEKQLINDDFFNLDIKFDLILEQTFFCALDPELRQAYANKMLDCLNPGGKLTGLLFTFPLTEKGPPFGGSTKEYLSYFEPIFNIKTLERCYNSIKPRSGNEVFFIFENKK